MARSINFNSTIGGGVYLDTSGGGEYSPTVGHLERKPPASASAMGGVWRMKLEDGDRSLSSLPVVSQIGTTIGVREIPWLQRDCVRVNSSSEK